MISKFEFHPVGQGLFCSGELFSLCDTSISNPRNLFRWVYDCGTSSKRSLLDEAIDQAFTAPLCKQETEPTIDLLVISHFDKDHINGLPKLLKKFHIGMVLLPYIPLWRRLMIAFGAKQYIDKDTLRFFINPVAYILDQAEDAGRNVDRIVFVKGGVSRERSTDERDGGGDIPWAIVIDEGDARDDSGGETNQELDDLKQHTAPDKIRMLDPGGRLRIPGVYEFAPYNDIDVHPLPGRSIEAFRRAVAERAGELITRTADKEKTDDLIRELKREYGDCFGTSAEQRNAISLFLYAGPLHGGSEETISALYTGDGYLVSEEQTNALLNHVGQARRAHLSCFQVMHHGSRANWHKDLAKKINPTISVFSSDPAHKKLKHPHPEVVDDFGQFCPLQVDQEHGVTVLNIFPGNPGWKIPAEEISKRHGCIRLDVLFKPTVVTKNKKKSDKSIVSYKSPHQYLQMPKGLIVNLLPLCDSTIISTHSLFHWIILEKGQELSDVIDFLS